MNELELTFAVREDLAIVGRNVEMADFGNPRGDLEGSVHYVVASAPDGRRFAHFASAFTINGWAIDPTDVDEEGLTTWTVDSNGMTVERLEGLAAHLNTHRPTLDPDRWTEIQAVYGSDAYVRDGWEQVAIDIEREEARFEGYRG